MCRLLGVTDFDYSRHETIVENFCELARTGTVMTGDPPGHEDGWGLAFYREGKLVVEKSGVNLLKERDRVTGILRRQGASPVMILHLRKSAWVDTTCTRHAHPFHHNNAVFAHNGVVYDYQGLLPAINTGMGTDALDTEVLFHHFLSAGSLDLGQAFLETVSVIKREKYRFSALNCVFSDGSRMYAYRESAKEPDYYSLYKAFAGNSCLVSSQPLDEGIPWTLMEQGEFLAVEAGS